MFYSESWYTLFHWIYKRKLNLLNRFLISHYVARSLIDFTHKTRSRKKSILFFFCVNRGNKLLCFYTKVDFENIGFRVFPSFIVCVNAALGVCFYNYWAWVQYQCRRYMSSIFWRSAFLKILSKQRIRTLFYDAFQMLNFQCSINLSFWNIFGIFFLRSDQ